jgi:hypothetical protein
MVQERLIIQRYKRAQKAISPNLDRGRFTGALFRALAKFPEARNAVIAEFDRIGGALV